MRVLQLGPYPPPWGGVQANLVAIRDYLRRLDIPCAALNLTRHRQQNADEVYYPKTALETLRLLATLRYDILHLHLGGDLTPRLLALSLLCCSLPGKKCVLSFHSGGYPSSPAGHSARRFCLRGFIFRRFDRVIAVNQAIHDLFVRFGVTAGKLRLIQPHALPESRPPAALPPQLAEFYRAHHPVLITVGLLEPEYDLELQIEALGLVRRRHPNAGLLIAGSGSLEADLRAAIQAKPWRDHILLAGDLDHAVTLEAIAQSAVFLRTTWYDGDSVAVREALHLGTPVVASDNGLRPEGVYLIPRRNLDALAGAVLERLEPDAGPPMRRPFGEENLRAVLQLYQEISK